MISTQNLTIGYKGRPIASNLNLAIETGKATAIIGKNGVGKSTLIKTLTGALLPLAGRVLIEEEDIRKISRKKMARLIAVITTEPHSAGGLRVEELVALGRTPFTGFTGRLAASDRNIVLAAMKRVGIDRMSRRFVAELSDGERQKCMLARGLAQQTPVIIMDEPFSYLDVASRLEVLELINELALKEMKTILYSTHEVTEALEYAHKIWAFVDNGIIAGSPEEIVNSGTADKIFLNEKVYFNIPKGRYMLKL